MNHGINKITNLSYIVNENNEVLLIMKKKGFGQGKWNGPGGKIQAQETPWQAAVREVLEETGYKMIQPICRGYIDFIWPEDKTDWNQKCYLFYTNQYSGNLIESKEALPQWIPIKNIPFDQMWGDDIYWLNDFLNGKIIKMRFYFDDNSKYLRHENIN